MYTTPTKPEGMDTLISLVNTMWYQQVLKTLSAAMKFHFTIYEPPNANEEQWGRLQTNGSFSGLLGEMCSGKADIALGNLYYTPYHLQMLDLSVPYNVECLTFLTPESWMDNSWQTLILPFQWVLRHNIEVYYHRSYVCSLKYVHICTRMQTRHAGLRRTRTNTKKWFVWHLPS